MTKKKAIDTFKNDNTTKFLGYEYQKLIALEMCLNAKPNQHMWIECKGDVADEVSTIEVKHHVVKNNLISNSEDAWKTIKNYIDNYELIKGFDNLILYTTSSIPANSIFHNWNNLTPEEKQNRLLAHTPAQTIKEHYEKIKAFPKNDLKAILQKSIIYSDQPLIAEKWKELRDHSAFTSVHDSFLDEAIKQMYGYITKAAIDNSNMWQISINDFRRDFKHSLSKYILDKIPFKPISNADIEDHTKVNFLFLQKIKNIKLKEKDQQLAVSDYLRAQMSQVEMLKLSPILAENLQLYDDNIEAILSDEKSQHSYNLTQNDLDTDKAHHESRTVYFNCRNRPHDQIVNVSDTQKYYRDGRIHHIAEISQFEWKYTEVDV